MKNAIFVFGLIATLVAATASAETAPAPASKSALLDKFKLTYVGFYHGPSLGKLDSSFTPAADGKIDETDPGNLQFAEDSLILGYKLTGDITISAAYNFGLYPLRPSPVGNDVKMIQTWDPTIKISHTKLYDNGKGLNLSGALRSYIPTSDSSKKADKVTQLRYDETLNWDMPNTRWSLGMDNTIRFHLYSSDVKSKTGDKFYLYFAPYSSYKISDVLNAKVAFEKDFTKKMDLPMGTGANGDIYLALEWAITPKINFSPQIYVQPTNLTMNSSQFYGLLIASIL